MAEGRLLRQLIRAGLQQETAEFRQAAEDVIREERAKKHHLLANDLERILHGDAGVRAPAGPPLVLPEVPTDGERGLSLLEVREPVRGLDDLVVAPEVRALLEQLVREQSRVELLASHGLNPIGRLLLCGPP